MATRPDPDARRRRRDAAAVLPLFGTLLLLPPFVNLFARNALLFGIPLEVVYLFGVWTALVLGALVMSRRLGRAPEVAEPAADPAHRPGTDIAPLSGADPARLSGADPACLPGAHSGDTR